MANIGARERRRRLTLGLTLLWFGVMLAIALVVAEVNRLWRFTLFFPFWVAAIGVLQAREKT